MRTPDALVRGIRCLSQRCIALASGEIFYCMSANNSIMIAQIAVPIRVPIIHSLSSQLRRFHHRCIIACAAAYAPLDPAALRTQHRRWRICAVCLVLAALAAP